METFEEAQTKISNERIRLSNRYPTIWQKIIEEWSQPSAEDCVWLTYSANYLLRTNGIRWAVDPFQLRARLPSAPEVDISNNLQQLSFILLTHIHADHFDPGLIKALSASPIRWMVPDFLLSEVKGLGIPDSSITLAAPGDEIRIGGSRILPFDGQHFHTGKKGVIHGVPEMGYLVDQGGKRWLFPGDTRTFDRSRSPQFGPVDAVFAHLWLGRNRAQEKQPPLLEEFCQFFSAIDTRRIVITHLHEVGRDARDYWNLGHFQLVRERLAQIRPDIQVTSAFTGDSVHLTRD